MCASLCNYTTKTLRLLLEHDNGKGEYSGVGMKNENDTEPSDAEGGFLRLSGQ